MPPDHLPPAETEQPDDWAIDVRLPWGSLALIAGVTAIALIMGVGLGAEMGWWK